MNPLRLDVQGVKWVRILMFWWTECIGLSLEAGHTWNMSIRLRHWVRTYPSSSINLYKAHMKPRQCSIMEYMLVGCVSIASVCVIHQICFMYAMRSQLSTQQSWGAYAQWQSMKYGKIGGLWVGDGAECSRSSRMEQNGKIWEKQRKIAISSQSVNYRVRKLEHTFKVGPS